MDERTHIKTREGVWMPRIIYGTAWKKERTDRLVAEAAIRGFRGFDTACQPKHYDENRVGQALEQIWNASASRGDFFVQTKFTSVDGQDPQSIPYDPEAPLSEQVAQSFEKSQMNLRTSKVDSLVLHGPLATFDRTLEVWRALEKIFFDGGTRQLGVCNCTSLDYLQSLWAEAKVKPAVVQNRFYAQTNYDTRLRRWCRENDVVYQSFWTLSANPHLLKSEALTSVSLTHNKTPAQILFRYLIDRGIVPLTGTTSPAHMEEDLEVLQFSLSSKQTRIIDTLFNR